jgi:hypothetical protein
VLALLIVAALLDIGLAVLLVADSGYAVADGALVTALAFFLASPVVGFVLRWRGFPRAAATVALVPALFGLILIIGL